MGIINMNKTELQKMAVEVRKGAVTGVYHAKSGHPGGSLSAADIYTYLFFEELSIDPKNPDKHCIVAYFSGSGYLHIECVVVKIHRISEIDGKILFFA